MGRLKSIIPGNATYIKGRSVFGSCLLFNPRVYFFLEAIKSVVGNPAFTSPTSCRVHGLAILWGLHATRQSVSRDRTWQGDNASGSGDC